MPLLTIRTGNGPAFRRVLAPDDGAYTIGRDATCALALDDPALSRRHARIEHRGDAWILVDEGSRNGTLLNGRAVHGSLPLADGDEVRIGVTSVTFQLDEDDAPDETVPAPLSADVPTSASERELVGRSDLMRRVLAHLDVLAPTPVHVLVLGETGTGKELAARRLHRRSRRTAGPFVVVNCPALPAALVESELFGVERGVATGVAERPGRIAAADGGTLFLDEVGDLDGAAQAKILRFLQEGTIDRLGGRRPLPVDVRVIAATNQDVEATGAGSRFRRDLLHRFGAVVRLPPLRDRPEDIVELVDDMLARTGGGVRMGAAAMTRLLAHDFPGNVRELEHVLAQAVLLARGSVILPEHLALDGATPDCEPPRDLARATALLERIVRGGESFWSVVREPYLARRLAREDVVGVVALALDRSGGSYKEAARLMGMAGQYKKLMNFLRHHGLQPGRA